MLSFWWYKFNLTIFKWAWKYRNVPEIVPENTQVSLKMIMSVLDSIIKGLAAVPEMLQDIYSW